jgi:peptidoglycan/xylan/chitin deacetylase (PgdA/CDA1 family)
MTGLLPGPLKRAARSLLSAEFVVRWAGRLSTGAAPVFMLHRFACPESGMRGHDVRQLADLLGFLRRSDFRVLSLAEVLSAAEQRTGLTRAVAFTVDDGYRDFYAVAAPVFREYECPVTVFLTTGFLDGTTWLWWDKVEYLVSNTREQSLTLPLPGAPRVYQWSTPTQRATVLASVVEELKALSTVDKLQMIDTLSSQLHIDLPRAAPDGYAPMSWDEVRELGQYGVSYGPHTVTHPVLSRVPQEECEWEIRESWRRVRAEVPEHVPVFCYPNGNPASFSGREQGILRAAGITAAVTAVEGYVRPAHFDPASPGARYAIPRIALGGDPRHQLRTVAGLGRLRRSHDDRFQKQVASWDSK